VLVRLCVRMSDDGMRKFQLMMGPFVDAIEEERCLCAPPLTIERPFNNASCWISPLPSLPPKRRLGSN